MRSLKLFLAAAAFATYFVGMIGVSAVTTGLVHSAMYPRAVSAGIAGDLVRLPR